MVGPKRETSGNQRSAPQRPGVFWSFPQIYLHDDRLGEDGCRSEIYRSVITHGMLLSVLQHEREIFGFL